VEVSTKDPISIAQENTVTKKPVLVYPFIAEDLIENADRCLLLGEDPLDCSSSHLQQLQQKKHYIKIIL
jgi:hypothetical protein